MDLTGEKEGKKERKRKKKKKDQTQGAAARGGGPCWDGVVDKKRDKTRRQLVPADTSVRVSNTHFPGNKKEKEKKKEKKKK